MRTRVGIWLGVGFSLLVAVNVLAAEPAKKQQSDQMMGDMKGCREHCQKTTQSIDQTTGMLDKAKASNDPAEMRKAIAEAQKSMAEMKGHMSGCMEMMENMGQMHGSMMGGKEMPSGGMMSDDKTAARVADPVCGMKVDPKTATSATYNGKTYYFCSAEDKAKFEKNPETYMKKKPA